MEDWSGTVYGPTKPRPRKKAAAAAPAAASSATRAAKTAGTNAIPAKRTPRKATAAPATSPAEVLDDELLAHLDVVLAEAAPPMPITAPATTGTAAAAPRQAPLWTLFLADPGFAPEHLASEAVRRLGPQAREWVARMRERYPRARPDALARLAAQEHVGIARRQATANTTVVGTWTEVGLLGRTQARLVLTIAAAYGADPTAEDRAKDLLDLLPIPRLTQPSLAAAGNVGRLLGAIAVRRVSARLIPFGAAVASAVHSGRTTQDVAMRAIDRFRPKPDRR